MYNGMRYIQENINEQMSLPDIAERFGYSKWHFSKKFHRATDMTLSESGLDFNSKGAVYDYYQIMFGSVPNLADSLAVIKKYVYEDKKYTLTELKNILLEDYPDEKVRMEFINKVPKFGNDIDEVDDIAVKLVEHGCDELEIMKAEFEARGVKVTIIDGVHDKEHVRKMAEENDLIIYAAYLAPHRPIGIPSLYGSVMSTYFNAFAFGKEKSIGVSMGYPYLCHDAMTGADTFLNIYSTNPEIQKAFVKALYGEITPTTKSPVDLEMKLRYIYC